MDVKCLILQAEFQLKTIPKNIEEPINRSLRCTDFSFQEKGQPQNKCVNTEAWRFIRLGWPFS